VQNIGTDNNCSLDYFSFPTKKNEADIKLGVLFIILYYERIISITYNLNLKTQNVFYFTKNKIRIKSILKNIKSNNAI